MTNVTAARGTGAIGRNAIATLILGAAVAALSACGQKGPLVLPDRTAPQEAAGSPGARGPAGGSGAENEPRGRAERSGDDAR